MKHAYAHELAAREILLHPGDLGCGDGGQVFGTVLGSCVAITLWHPRRQFGCICHFLLPTQPASGGDGRYAPTAFAMMRHELAAHQVPLHQCVAKVFGGGRMFDQSPVLDIGARNVAAARALLAQAGLAPAATHVGGGYRHLYFDVDNGDVWIRGDGDGNDGEDEFL